MNEYYKRDTRAALPQAVRRFVVGAWSDTADWACSRQPEASVIVLAVSPKQAEDTIRQLKPNFEVLEAEEAVKADEDKHMLLTDFRNKYNTP